MHGIDNHKGSEEDSDSKYYIGGNMQSCHHRRAERFVEVHKIPLHPWKNHVQLHGEEVHWISKMISTYGRFRRAVIIFKKIENYLVRPC